MFSGRPLSKGHAGKSLFDQSGSRIVRNDKHFLKVFIMHWLAEPQPSPPPSVHWWGLSWTVTPGQDTRGFTYTQRKKCKGESSKRQFLRTLKVSNVFATYCSVFRVCQKCKVWLAQTELINYACMFIMQKPWTLSSAWETTWLFKSWSIGDAMLQEMINIHGECFVLHWLDIWRVQL